MSSSKKLPEHIEGFVDLQTLVNIHKYLSESEKIDDTDLAAWVKEHYLQEPLAEEGRQIRDNEGFVKLDKAYRRVRQLTGKAQDKFPFFDGKWRKMSPTVVKNLLLGDAIMGANHSVTKGDTYESSTSNVFDGQHDAAQDISNLPEAVDISNTSKHQQQPEVLSSTARVGAQHQAPNSSNTSPASTTSDPNTRTGSASVSGRGAEMSERAPNGTASPVDPLRDAGAGKVRGPDGRYHNKAKLSPATVQTPSGRSGPNIRYVKKSRSSAALDTGSQEENDAEDERMVNLVSDDADPDHNVSDILNTDDSFTTNGSGETTATESTEDGRPSVTVMVDAPRSSPLACEAEAVWTTLDRVPPGVMKKKRKSEAAHQHGNTKRARGSRGGVIGRPRRAEQAMAHSTPAVGAEDIKQEPSPPEATAKVASRRSTRKTAASLAGSSPPTEPTDKDGPKGSSSPNANANDAAIADDSHVAAVASNGTAPNKSDLKKKDHMLGAKQTVQDIYNGVRNGGPYTEVTPSKIQKTPSSSKQKKRVSFSPETNTRNVELFARITTGEGIQEVPLSDEDITSDVSLLKRYAAWQEAGEPTVSFEMFKDIVKFAK